MNENRGLQTSQLKSSLAAARYLLSETATRISFELANVKDIKRKTQFILTANDLLADLEKAASIAYWSPNISEEETQLANSLTTLATKFAWDIFVLNNTDEFADIVNLSNVYLSGMIPFAAFKASMNVILKNVEDKVIRDRLILLLSCYSNPL
jgi:hypothetical protein